MRVLLAGPDFEENLSIRYLASSLQAERHEPSLAVFNSAEDVETVAEQAGECDLVGLSVCFQSRAQEFPDLATSVAFTRETDSTGQYTAKDLTGGKYDVKAEAKGFKTTVVKGVEVNAGKATQLDIRLEIGNWSGCCEYAAAPMKAPDDYYLKIKPFTYSVGESQDGNTLKGIAKLVYGDQRKWVQIYEANPDVVTDPNALFYGMSLTIPASHPPEPKLETKVLPPYPAEASTCTARSRWT
jgi:carboxypeptidase family protein